MPVLRHTPFLRVLAVGVAAAGTLTGAAVAGPAASASAAASGAGHATATAWGAAGPVSDCLTLTSPTCYSPRQFRTAYGIQPLTDRGITGRGETVVMPEFAAAPGEAGVTDVRQDIARYDSVFGLPAWLGPGDRLGQPERQGAHPAARPLRHRLSQRACPALAVDPAADAVRGEGGISD